MCSIESGLRQKGHLSSEVNLYFSSSFFIVIILCITSKEDCLKISNNDDDKIKLLVLSENTAKEVEFKWLHHKNSSSGSKVIKTTFLYMSGGEGPHQ